MRAAASRGRPRWMRHPPIRGWQWQVVACRHSMCAAGGARCPAEPDKARVGSGKACRGGGGSRAVRRMCAADACGGRGRGRCTPARPPRGQLEPVRPHGRGEGGGARRPGQPRPSRGGRGTGGRNPRSGRMPRGQPAREEEARPPLPAFAAAASAFAPRSA